MKRKILNDSVSLSQNRLTGKIEEVIEYLEKKKDFLIKNRAIPGSIEIEYDRSSFSYEGDYDLFLITFKKEESEAEERIRLRAESEKKKRMEREERANYERLKAKYEKG